MTDSEKCREGKYYYYKKKLFQSKGFYNMLIIAYISRQSRPPS